MEYLTNPQNIRNICILAHVDHGKTTIADSLISSNGIISHKMAGKMRYLDNRQDEQERGITMKSSSIALKYSDPIGEKFLVNLVDTPGHVDFCGEVSAAVRLCDGALIVVDVVEGVCPQTKVALEQAWKEGIEPILVLNKIDRLILEQQLDETAAHLRLNQLLEQVNAIVAVLLTTELLEDESCQESQARERKKKFSLSESEVQPSSSHVYDWASAIDDVDDDKYYFAPTRNNVVFASSIDDWAFTIDAFAKVLSDRHKINLAALQKTLWGDYYIDTRQKKILPNAQSKAKKNLFCSMVLENIWKLYDIVCVRRDKVRMAKICDVLNIKLSPRDMNYTDSRYQTKLIMSKWLQLSENVLGCVTRIVPSPRHLSEKRVERLLSSSFRSFGRLPEESKNLKAQFLECSQDEEAVKIACISKMFPIERKNLPEHRLNIIKRPNSSNLRSIDKVADQQQSDVGTQEIQSLSLDENEVLFIAFARVFSGKLRPGDKLYVLGPRHDPTRVDSTLIASIDESKKLDDLEIGEHVTVATVDNFYLFMGRDVEKIDYAPAGNIVGILGLDKHLIRTATLSNNIYCPPFNDLHLSAAPILRVAIETTNPLDMPLLINGLKLLNQADPCVVVKLQNTGEHVIVATGEVHLEHCIKDLRERYTNNIELNISQPIVPFRETIVLPPKTDMVNEAIDDNNLISAPSRKNLSKRGIFELLTPNKRCRIKIRASPLPEEVLSYLVSSADQLKIISRLVTSKHRIVNQSACIVDNIDAKKILKFKSDLEQHFAACRRDKSIWRSLYPEDVVDQIWSFGPKYSGPNMLVSAMSTDFSYNQWHRITDNEVSNRPNSSGTIELSDFIDSFVSGFQLASQSGPLCEEPMMGVCFAIIDWSLIECSEVLLASEDRDSDVRPISDSETDQSESTTNQVSLQQRQQHKDNFGPMSGQIISTVKECCRGAFQSQPQRLMSPMFSCDIQVTADVLGKMYAVLGRRHGRILHGDMREGSQTFEVQAFIPVIESLDFVSETRKQTSGMANPQLIFSHYELIDIDPFWTPNTEEEYALFGEKADTENRARKYMNLVRRRKGLAVQEKIVEHAEKQRTIKRNK